MAIDFGDHAKSNCRAMIDLRFQCSERGQLPETVFQPRRRVFEVRPLHRQSLEPLCAAVRRTVKSRLAASVGLFNGIFDSRVISCSKSRPSEQTALNFSRAASNSPGSFADIVLTRSFVNEIAGRSAPPSTITGRMLSIRSPRAPEIFMRISTRGSAARNISRSGLLPSVMLGPGDISGSVGNPRNSRISSTATDALGTLSSSMGRLVTSLSRSTTNRDSDRQFFDSSTAGRRAAWSKQ